MADDVSTRYLDPQVLNKVASLELKARLVVAGFISGMHKSPYRGYSVEFAEHREYSPGDELRHLDWKVFGKTDRFYVKQYEEETNFSAYILLDTSESMTYRGRPELPSKLEYGCYAAASLAYLIQQQQDAVGLYPFHTDIYRPIPPATHRSKLMEMMRTMDSPDVGEDTGVGPVLNKLAGSVGRRGIVIIISDLFDLPANFKDGLAQLHAKRHDVIVLHLLDHDELTFPFERLTRFVGLEQYDDLTVDPRPLQKAYLEEVEAFTQEIRRTCLRGRADYQQIDTSTRLDVVLSTYLATRSAAQRAKA
jgi:uncharacterized protein (DUF58 family)